MRFVLVHGGWQGGWAWDGVSALLRAGSHGVFAPTLRGLAEGDTGRAGVTLADMAAGLIQEIGEQDLRDFVVAGHSGGFDQPIGLPRFFGLRLPASYIFLRDDRATPRARYEAMAARLREPRRVECDGSHQAMLTRPDAVATALIAATADTTGAGVR